VTFLERNLPECSAWVGEVTHIAIPFRGENGLFRSRSHPDIPGVVELDLLSEMEILEALVHESAHLYLYRAECEAPLIETGYEGLHRSPLRPEPRPLRGIMLAMHALAHIALFYRETEHLDGVSHWSESELSERLALANEAAQTLADAWSHLTPAGRQFVDDTRQVLGYATH
jgi:HEXXH motif-containing protein